MTTKTITAVTTIGTAMAAPRYDSGPLVANAGVIYVNTKLLESLLILIDTFGVNTFSVKETALPPITTCLARRALAIWLLNNSEISAGMRPG